MNLSMNLVASAEGFPDHTALHRDDQVLTYAQKVWLTDSLPKGATGKILRREVKIPAEAEQA